MGKPKHPDESWADYLHGHDPMPLWERRLFRLLPHDPRCKLCSAPFRGAGGMVMRHVGFGPSSKNPRFCNMCEVYIRKHRGGAEIPMSFMFADVRGSTALAERISPSEFSRLLNRFYAVANHLIIDRDAFVDKLVGDEVVAFFPPLIGRHARVAIETAQRLLEATGHGAPDGPWIPVGIGLHTGRAYYGVVGTEDTVTDITALGDDVNVTSRLVGLAAAGEIMVSDAAAAASGLDLNAHEHRFLDLKGRIEPIGVRVLRSAAAVPVG